MRTLERIFAELSARRRRLKYVSLVDAPRRMPKKIQERPPRARRVEAVRDREAADDRLAR
jgi:hypothetical protein